MQTQTEEIPFSSDFFLSENVYNEIIESISIRPVKYILLATLFPSCKIDNGK